MYGFYKHPTEHRGISQMKSDGKDFTQRLKRYLMNLVFFIKCLIFGGVDVLYKVSKGNFVIGVLERGWHFSVKGHLRSLDV